MNRNNHNKKKENGTNNKEYGASKAFYDSIRINKRKAIYIVNFILTICFIVFSFMLLAVKNGFMLKWYDEMSLFEPNYHFFRQFVYFPGGLLRYVGTFLTQFLYHPFLGGSLLICLWLIIIWLTRKSFGLKDSLYPLVFVLPVSLMVSVLQLDEAWLTMKAPGYVFSNTLGYLFAIFSYLIYVKVDRNRVVALLTACVIVICYFAAGFYALLAAGLCVIRSIVGVIRSRRYMNVIAPLAIAAFIIIFPRLYYVYFEGNTVDNEYLYLKGLPQLYMESFDAYLWCPLIVATLSLLVFEVISFIKSERLRYSIVLNCLLIVPVFASGIWSVIATRKSEQLRATVLMLQCIDNNDWVKGSRVMSLIQEPPNYSMMVLKNLIDVVLGGESRDLSQYEPVTIDSRHSEKFSMTAFVEVPVNYYIGHFNQSYRWAMEHTVQYGKRVFFLKYMVKDALLRGEYKLAERYNDILLSTLYHRKWAQVMDSYIKNPELIKTNDEFVYALRMNEEESSNP